MKSILSDLSYMLVFFIVAVAVVAQFYVFVPVKDKIAILYGVTPTNAIFLTTAFSIFYAGGYLIWGILAEKFGKKNIILSGLISLSIITIIIAYTKNYTTLLTLRCVQGFFASSFPATAIVILISSVQEKNRYVAISILSCAFLISGSIGQQLGLIMINKSITNVMLLSTLIYSVGIVFIKNRIKKDTLVNTSVNLMNIFKVFKNKQLLKAYLPTPFVLGSFLIFHTMLPASSSILTFNRVAFIGFLTSLCSAYLIKKFSIEKVLPLALLFLGSVHCLTLISLYTGSGPLLIIHGAFTAGVGLVVPSLITFVNKYAGNYKTFATSIYTFLLFIGAGAGATAPQFCNGFIIMAVQVGILLLASGILFRKPKIN